MTREIRPRENWPREIWPGVQRHRLGGASLLHACDSGALVLAGAEAVETARIGLSDRRAGRPVSVQAAQILGEWDAAGIFLTAPPPFPDPVPWRAPEAAARPLALGGRRVALRCEDAALAEDLDAVLAPLWEDGSEEQADASVDILQAGDGHAVFRDGGATWGRANVFVTRHRALREILIGLSGAALMGAVLHAAAVAREGRALVLAGDSGSGKSTLGFQLMEAGWAQVADDLTGLDRAGRALPFPTRISLKSGSWGLARAAALEAAPLRGVGGVAARYLPPPAVVPPGAALPVGAFVFPSYHAGAAPEVTRIAPETALVRLIECGGRLAGTPESAAGLVAALTGAPSFEVVHGGGAAALEICAALLEAAPAGPA